MRKCSETAHSHNYSSRSIALVLIPVVFGLGVLVRLAYTLLGASLSSEEATVAIAALTDSPTALSSFGPGTELFPPLLLPLIQGVSLAWGTGEIALRLPSLFAGVTALLIFCLIADKLLGRGGKIVAISLFAASPTLVVNSAGVTFLSFELLVSVLLTFLALRFIEQESSFFDSVILAIFGAASLWLTTSRLIVLGGVIAVLLIELFFSRTRERWGKTLLVVGSILWSWVALVRVTQVDSLQIFHHLTADRLFESLGQVNFDFVSVLRLAGDYFPIWLAIGVVFVLWGGVALLRERSLILVLLVVPILAAAVLGVSLNSQTAGNLTIVILPQLILLIGFGFERMFEIRPRFFRLFGALAMVALLTLSAWMTIEVFQDSAREEMRGLLEEIELALSDEDVIYVVGGAEPLFNYYSQHHPIRFAQRGTTLVGSAKLLKNEGLDAISQKSRERSSQSVWFITRSIEDDHSKDDLETVLEFCRHNGKIENRVRKAGVTTVVCRVDMPPEEA